MPKRSYEERGLKKKSQLFKKGVSGNPAGRPKGAKGKAAELKKLIKEETGALRKIVEGESMYSLSESMPSMVQKAIDMGLEGNETMLKFCIERFVPKATFEEAQKGGLGRVVINVSPIEPPKIIEGELDG